FHALDERAHDMLLVTRVSMHDVPTLSHETPLTNNQGNKPTEQGIEPPQQQRHHQNNGNHDKSGLRGFLAGRPDNLTNFDARFFQQHRERLATSSLKRHESSKTTQHNQTQNAIQNRLGREVLITYDTHNNQGSDNQPLDQ